MLFFIKCHAIFQSHILFPLHLIVKKWNPVFFLPVRVQQKVGETFSRRLVLMDTLWQNMMYGGKKKQMERNLSQESWHEPDGFDCLAKQYCNRLLACVQAFALTTWEFFGGGDGWFISAHSCSRLYSSTGIVQLTGSVTIQRGLSFKKYPPFLCTSSSTYMLIRPDNGSVAILLPY